MALHLVSREFKADFRIWGILIILLVSHSLALAEEAHEWVTDPSEVIALRAVRSRLIDPMNSLISWNKGDPCRSKWKGVSCFDNVLNTSKDGYLHIQELLLLNMNLSGSLAPEIGQLSHLEILDFMWNNIQGSIPKEIGSIKSLKLLLLNGNQLSGSLPDGLGYLSKLNRLQIDENNISGPIPKSFVNLIEMRHLHMNNNSISGQIPPELAQLPKILHFLLDNNNLSGHLPPNFSESQSLLIFQLDNNNFSGSSIPVSYGKFTKLVKLSLRNCSLQGTIPDLSEIPELTYLDLSWNQLEGSIPSKKLSANITTIELSNNKLNGSIPTNFSGLPNLQKLSLKNNMLTGSFPSVWENMTFRENASLILDFQNNSLSNVSSSITPPLNVTILLQGNQVCSNANQLNVIKFCNSTITKTSPGNSSSTASGCLQQSCPKDDFFEYNPASPLPCYCAAPIRVGYRLKSPGFSDFFPYMDSFEAYLDLDVSLTRYQLYIDSFVWEEGPRLRMYLKIFPNLSPVFNESEVRRIRNLFAGWKIHNRDIFGPYELLNFTLLGPYSNMILDSRSGWNRGALLGIIIGTVAGAIVLSTIVSLIIMKRHMKYQHLTSKRSSLSNSGIKVDGVKDFSFEEIAQATSNFCNSAQIGQGGYGTVYKGILTDGTIVAIKRAQEGSLQGSKEFCNEIEFLSRLHHRNLVSLVGYCDEESEQMLIYEFMPNGTLRDHLSIKSKKSLGFPLRLRIALGSAKGILYLHTEADPPVFHRDIKATNILLDSKFTAKVADFGLSILAPVPDDDGMVHGHVSTVVRGTPGYLDPEYFLTHKLTDKSDVYSLGVVFLELLTGMHPISHGKNIVREARNAYQHGRISSIIDKRMDSYPQECVEKFMSLALKCCDENTSARPSMAEVVRELEVIWRMTPDIDVTVSMETDSSPVESQSSISGDLYKSLNHSCSDTQKSGITMVYPR